MRISSARCCSRSRCSRRFFRVMNASTATTTTATHTATGTMGDFVTLMMRSPVSAKAFEKISSSLMDISL